MLTPEKKLDNVKAAYAGNYYSAAILNINNRDSVPEEQQQGSVLMNMTHQRPCRHPWSGLQPGAI